MCGIFGILGEYEQNKANSALAKLSHRGSDECNIIQKPNLFFAHQRLSILNINSKYSLHVEGIYISFNGEIYNYKELRDELSDFHKFQTNSESELIVVAYKKWGKEFVNHLRGMFAIALLDDDVLYLFRDRLGKKPLFYLKQNNSFIFSSEIKALIPFLNKVEMDEDALLSYLSFLAPTPPFTFFQDIKKLASAECLTYKNHKINIEKYYDILDIRANVVTCRDEAVKLIEAQLEESIGMRLGSDVPMASLLSGGIDSATLNYFAKNYGKNLQTYTLGYDGFSKYDEIQNAKDSAKSLGLENKALKINQNDFIDASEKVLDTLDEPLNDPASVPLYLLFEEIKKDGYKVVLSGEGSDELFLGYRQYFEYLDIESLAKIKNKNWLKRYFKSNFSQNREWEHYKRIFEDTTLFRTSGESFTDLQKNDLLALHVEDNQALKYLKQYEDSFKNSLHVEPSSWYRYIDLNIFQAEHFLSKLDRVSMAHGIESRTPFLDHKLIEAVFSIWPKLFYEDGVTKSLLKEVMKDKLDKKILTRKKKGFSNPYIEYLIESKKISLIQEVNKQTGLFKEKKLSEYIKGAKSGAFKQHIWGLFVLSVWMKKYLL